MKDDSKKGHPRVADRETLQAISEVGPEDFVKYLNISVPENKCPLCGGALGVSPSPDGKTATLVASPSPIAEGYGVWHFLASCINCGHSSLFLATHVADRVKRFKAAGTLK